MTHFISETKRQNRRAASCTKRVGFGILKTSFNFFLQNWLHLLESLVLVFTQLPHWMHMLDSVFAERHLGCEIRQICYFRFNVCTLRHLHTCKTREDSTAQTCTSICHGQSRTTLAVFRLYHFCARILHPPC